MNCNVVCWIRDLYGLTLANYYSRYSGQAWFSLFLVHVQGLHCFKAQAGPNHYSFWVRLGSGLTVFSRIRWCLTYFFYTKPRLALFFLKFVQTEHWFSQRIFSLGFDSVRIKIIILMWSGHAKISKFWHDPKIFAMEAYIFKSPYCRIIYQLKCWA